MRILNVKLGNFGSYPSLGFDFQNHGLTLIQGATGSGKSTLCDAVPWILFGRTAKGGAVNEVIGWNGSGETTGIAEIEVKGERISVYRQRGKVNDFYFSKDSNPSPIRGKDLADTQKLLNSLLGIDAELYLSGAYFHEFSQTAQFFTTTAKNRRTICEQIVDLSLAKTLQMNTATNIKVLKDQLSYMEGEIQTLRSNVSLLYRLQETENGKHTAWEVNHASTKHRIATNLKRFEEDRKKIITNKCSSCGTVLAEPREITNTAANPYLSQLEILESETNPHTGSVKSFLEEIDSKQHETEYLELRKSFIVKDITDLGLLVDVLAEFRGLLIKNTVQDLETNTNKFLTNHFDAEITIALNIVDADKLEVSVQKDGNECVYSQLSKGQRQLLKLCFGVSVMQAVENHHGVKFAQIFLDEALDGCDDQIKLKALQLLRTISLQYESVFIIEHSSEFKAQMENQYKVELVNGESQIAHM